MKNFKTSIDIFHSYKQLENQKILQMFHIIAIINSSFIGFFLTTIEKTFYIQSIFALAFPSILSLISLSLAYFYLYLNDTINYKNTEKTLAIFLLKHNKLPKKFTQYSTENIHSFLLCQHLLKYGDIIIKFFKLTKKMCMFFGILSYIAFFVALIIAFHKEFFYLFLSNGLFWENVLFYVLLIFTILGFCIMIYHDTNISSLLGKNEASYKKLYNNLELKRLNAFQTKPSESEEELENRIKLYYLHFQNKYYLDYKKTLK